MGIGTEPIRPRDMAAAGRQVGLPEGALELKKSNGWVKHPNMPIPTRSLKISMFSAMFEVFLQWSRLASSVH